LTEATVEAAAAATTASTNVLPFANDIARKLALVSLGVAILSWADHEVRKKKRLTPLPLFYYSTTLLQPNGGSSGGGGDDTRIITTRDLKQIVLPPFLPEEVHVDDFHDEYDNGSDEFSDELHHKEDTNENQDKLRGLEMEASSSLPSQIMNDDPIGAALNTDSNNVPSTELQASSTSSPNSLSPSSESVKDYWNSFYHSTKPQTFLVVVKKWFKMNQIRKQEEHNAKRQSIMNELISLQLLKRQKMMQNKKKWKNKIWLKQPPNVIERMSSAAGATLAAPPGYAIVTGASRGIGRAFAIELARYEIPLILIARDVEKLSSLACDIQTAYGVPCVIIEADLSKRGTAQKIFETTKKSGLKVDILINNAGVCTSKDIVDTDTEDIERMMDINVGSTTILSHLYAKEMKYDRRGRILFVSSMVGAVPSGPGVATYAATKAYEKSLAQSMGRELEKYGVGVTCLMPGAVKDTSFAFRSNANEAVCFKLPFYPLKAQNVVSAGVRALLHSGDGEVIPGWHNRMFLKIFMPIFPPRLTSSLVALAWSPFRLPFGSRGDMKEGTNRDEMNETRQGVVHIPSVILNDNKPPTVLDLLGEAEISRTDEIIEEKEVVIEPQPDTLEDESSNKGNNTGR
jgi:short-subunit dehydrogenase